MNETPAFLTVSHVQAIHQRVIDDFGGDPSTRDMGLLESAVTMPAAQFGGEYLHAGIPAMAAAYLFHLCQGHTFVDDNKRVALASAEVFLLLNGMRLGATNEEVEVLTLSVASSEASKDDVIAFFERHAVPE